MEKKSEKKKSQYSLIHSFTWGFCLLPPWCMESTVLAAAQELGRKSRQVRRTKRYRGAAQGKRRALNSENRSKM